MLTSSIELYQKSPLGWPCCIHRRLCRKTFSLQTGQQTFCAGPRSSCPCSAISSPGKTLFSEASSFEYNTMSSDEQVGIKRPGSKLQKGNGIKKKSGYDNYYFQSQAESSESRSEDDQGIQEDSDMAQRRLQAEKRIENRNKNILPSMHMDQAEVDNYWRNRVKMDHIFQANHWITPTSKDPKMFAVEVAKGRQRDLTLQLLNKAFICKDTDKALNIGSVAYVEKSPGLIFIQATNVDCVMHALDGMQGILSRKFQVVKIEYYGQIFSAKTQKKLDIKAGNYVRVKGGLYDGDLAKIVKVNQNGSVDVAVCPRVDLFEITTLKNQGKIKQLQQILNHSKYIKGSRRPQQRKLFKSDIMGIPQLKSLKLWDDGLIIMRKKPSKLSVFTFQNVKFHEMNHFNGDSENPMESFKNQLKNVNIMVKYERGDKVKVISGAYTGVKGRVQNIDEGGHFGKGARLFIKPKIEKEADQTNKKQIKLIQVSPMQVSKYFKERDHVRVMGGRHAGKTGIVLLIKQHVATIFTENGNEINVLVNELTYNKQHSIVPNVDEQSNNKYQRYDLVRLGGGQGAACVLMSQKDSLKVLDCHNNVKVVNFLQVQQKIESKFNFAKNSLNQEFSNGAVVRVKEGPRGGKKCQVRHIFKDTLFLYNPQFYSTCAVVAQHCTNCILISASQSRVSRKAPPKNEQQKDNQDKIFIVGKTINIEAGQWKGYQGCIKSVGKDFITVQLNAKFKTVQVKKQLISAGKTVDLDYGKTPRPIGGQTIYMNSPGPGMTPSRPLFEDH